MNIPADRPAIIRSSDLIYYRHSSNRFDPGHSDTAVFDLSGGRQSGWLLSAGFRGGHFGRCGFSLVISVFDEWQG